MQVMKIYRLAQSAPLDDPQCMERPPQGGRGGALAERRRCPAGGNGL